MRPVSPRLYAVLLLACCLWPATLPATTVYRWVDAQGQTHFTQVPPEGRPYEVIRSGTIASGATPSREDPPEDGPTMEERTRQFLERREAEAKAKAEAEAEEREARETAERKCREATERARFLEERTARRLVVPADDGNLARMDEDEFMRRLNAAKEQVKIHCR